MPKVFFLGKKGEENSRKKNLAKPDRRSKQCLPTIQAMRDPCGLFCQYPVPDTGISIVDGVVKTSIHCVVCPVAILDILHVWSKPATEHDSLRICVFT